MHGLQTGETEFWVVTVVQPRGSENFNQGRHGGE